MGLFWCSYDITSTSPQRVAHRIRVDATELAWTRTQATRADAAGSAEEVCEASLCIAVHRTQKGDPVAAGAARSIARCGLRWTRQGASATRSSERAHRPPRRRTWRRVCDQSGTVPAPRALASERHGWYTAAQHGVADRRKVGLGARASRRSDLCCRLRLAAWHTARCGLPFPTRAA